MSFTRGFHPKRKPQLRGNRLDRAGICRLGVRARAGGDTWDDLRVSDAAEREASTYGLGVLDLFLQQHWRSLPKTFRGNRQSVLRSGGRAYLIVTTWCDRGRVLGLVQTAREAGGVD